MSAFLAKMSVPARAKILDPCFAGSKSTGYQPPAKCSAQKQHGKKSVPNLTGVSCGISDADHDDVLTESGMEPGPSTTGGAGEWH